MLRQRTPWDLTRLARQVSPHDLVMGGISLAGSRQLDLTFFPLRAFLGILAHFSMWNLESFYPGNPSEWLLIRIALDVRLMRNDIYMTFNLIIKNIVYLDNDPNTCICVVSSRRCWSFLYVPSVNIGYLHCRCTMNTADMISCPWNFAYLRSWRDSLMSSTRFSYLST